VRTPLCSASATIHGVTPVRAGRGRIGGVDNGCETGANYRADMMLRRSCPGTLSDRCIAMPAT
jgi:hypothetical protein